MNESKKITVEFTIKEAQILARAIRGYQPPQDEEMISVMLYARILKKVEENS